MENSLTTVPSLIRSALIFDRSLTNENVEVDFVRNETEFLERVHAPQLSYQSVFVSTDQAGFSAIDVVIASRLRFPLSPVFLIGGGENPMSPTEMKRLGIGDFITRAKLEEILQWKMKRYRHILPALSKAVHLRDSRVSTGSSIPEPFQFLGFRPVLAEDLLSEDVSLFDVHMLLPTQKMIKIFAANDSFDISRALAYIAGGVHWVYVKESGVQQCVQYCRLFLENLVENKTISTEMRFLQLAGLSESHVKKIPESAHSAFELSRRFGKLINRESKIDTLIELFLNMQNF